MNNPGDVTISLSVGDHDIPTSYLEPAESQQVDVKTQRLTLGLVLLKEMAGSREDCPGDEPCGNLCACRINSVANAMLDILFNSPDSGIAAQFLKESFMAQKGLSLVLH